MTWIYLFAAGLCEIAWAIGLKLAQPGRPFLSAMTLGAMVASFVLLWLAMRGIPLGTAYAVWTGIGTAGTAAVGLFFFGESRAWPRLACLALILLGIIGLKLTASSNPPG